MGNISSYRRFELFVKTGLMVMCSVFTLIFVGAGIYALDDYQFFAAFIALFCLVGFAEMTAQLLKELSDTQLPNDRIYRFSQYYLIIQLVIVGAVLFCLSYTAAEHAFKRAWYEAGFHLFYFFVVAFYWNRLKSTL